MAVLANKSPNKLIYPREIIVVTNLKIKVNIDLFKFVFMSDAFMV